tara:strand:+ start:436 stop:663 length:228 start_codon:yes stop_codon:yes gene_type:complete
LLERFPEEVNQELSRDVPGKRLSENIYDGTIRKSLAAFKAYTWFSIIKERRKIQNEEKLKVYELNRIHSTIRTIE